MPIYSSVVGGPDGAVVSDCPAFLGIDEVDVVESCVVCEFLVEWFEVVGGGEWFSSGFVLCECCGATGKEQ